MGENIGEAKQKLRKELLELRTRMPIDERTAAALSGQLFDLISSEKVSVIGCYLPFGSEPPLQEFLDQALIKGLKVVSPVCISKTEMEWVVFNGKTKKGLFGFEEATGEAADASEIELMVMPALAVDLQGHRMGRGGGFYDRQLEKLSPELKTVAVVFDSEILDSVPVEEHDKKVQFAVSPSKTLRFIKLS